MLFNQTELWSERRYVDFWTIPHILAGVVIGGFLYWFQVPFWLNLSISMFIITGWEFFELHVLNIHEHLGNKIMDVVTGFLGFLAMYYFMIRHPLEIVLKYLFIMTALYLFLNAWGFLSYKRKKLSEI